MRKRWNDQASFHHGTFSNWAATEDGFSPDASSPRLARQIVAQVQANETVTTRRLQKNAVVAIVTA